MARWIVVLPASFGPWTIVRPGASGDLELAVAAEVAELQAGDPHSVTSWPARRRRPSRSDVAQLGRLVGRRPVARVAPRARRSGASTSRMKAPGIVSGDGSGALGQGGHATVADADLEEAALRARASTSSIEQVELVRPDAGEPDVEDEVGVGPCAERRRRAPAGRRSSRRRCRASRTASGRPARSSTVTVRAPSASSSSTSSTLPAPSWSTRRARARRRRRTSRRPPCPAARSASGRARGSRARSPRSPRGVKTTSSRSVLPGIASEPWTIPIVPGGGPSPRSTCRSRSGLCGARFVAKTGPWTTTSQRGEVDARAVRRQDRHESSSGGRSRRAPRGRGRGRSRRGRRRRGCPG